MIELKCPLDGGALLNVNGDYCCDLCDTKFKKVDVGGHEIYDFRCIGTVKETSLTFTVPVHPIRTGNVEKFGKATDARYQCLSRQKIRKLYDTKLQKEILYYINILLNETGPNAKILDLGCGNGGNKKYLESIGFRNIVSVDYMSTGAEYLVDVHRLPFADEIYDIVLTTSTLEHFYNPYIAFKEMSRILNPNGFLIASGSFWESWHGNSCFHFTPGGVGLLCDFANLDLLDMWPGWGFIPSVFTHALGLRKFKHVTYQFQKFFNGILTLFRGKAVAKRHMFNTAGSLGFYARKL